MKKVAIAFEGTGAEEMAKKFFTYLVDGGLEDHLMQVLGGKGTDLEIKDCDTNSLTVVFQCKKSGAAPQKKVKAS